VVAAFGEAGAAMMGAVASPLLGAKGNVEFLLHLANRRPSGPVPEIDAGVESAVAAGLRLRAGTRAAADPAGDG
jgi:hypothetical protein